MAILKVSQIGHPILTRRCDPIRIPAIKSKATQELIDHMIETLREEGGVGLAAPQVYNKLRIVVVQHKSNDSSFRKENIPLTVLVNPIILESSEEKELDWEGCLSIDHGMLWGIVPRPKSVVIEGFDRKGKKVRIKAAGFKARVLQHELDHLDGILFPERMRERDLKHLTTPDQWAKYHRDKWPEARPVT